MQRVFSDLSFSIDRLRRQLLKNIERAWPMYLPVPETKKPAWNSVFEHVNFDRLVCNGAMSVLFKLGGIEKALDRMLKNFDEMADPCIPEMVRDIDVTPKKKWKIEKATSLYHQTAQSAYFHFCRYHWSVSDVLWPSTKRCMNQEHSKKTPIILCWSVSCHLQIRFFTQSEKWFVDVTKRPKRFSDTCKSENKTIVMFGDTNSLLFDFSLIFWCHVDVTYHLRDTSISQVSFQCHRVWMKPTSHYCTRADQSWRVWKLNFARIF